MTAESQTTSGERSATLQATDKAIERITELLNSEITFIRSEYERPGWTRWALLGGIASTIWLIMDRVEQDSFEVMNVMTLFLAFSLMLYVLANLSILLDSLHADGISAGRFRVTNRWFAQSRAGLMVFLAHSIAVIAIANSVRAHVPWPFTAMVYVVYGLLTCVLLLAFALTCFSYPFRLKPGSPRSSKVFDLVLIVGSVIPAVAYLDSVIRSPSAASVEDFRMASLLVVLYYLLRTLAGLRGKTPILNSLVATRRELLCGRIDIETAMQQINIALAGLEVSDILHEDVRGLLDLWRTYGAEMHKASEKMKTLRMTVERIAGSEEEPDEQNLSILESLGNSIRSHMETGSGIQDEIDQCLQRFNRKTKLLARISREAEPAVTEVLNQVNAAAKEAGKCFEEFVEESEALSRYVKETLTARAEDGE